MVPVQHIAITADDGSLLIMSFVLEDARQGWKRAPTPENVAAEIKKASENWTAKPVSWRLIDTASIPADRSFRAAWVDDGAGIVHDIAKARAIHLEAIRHARNKLLADSDVLVTRAMECGDDTRDLANRRQALRDLPATIAPALSAAKTIEALKAIQLPE